MKFEWTCPHCSKPQIVTDNNYHLNDFNIMVGQCDLGDVGTRNTAIACLNDRCRKLTLDVTLKERRIKEGNWALGKTINHWRLIPESTAKPQPDYIPEPLRLDYLESCRIRELSPKASATLARRCLQGMIRNFTGIAKATLDQEIKELKTRVESGTAPQGVTIESVEAIDHVRTIGNIGAHMEKDVNLVVDIEPDEAQVLIELIEMLFDEWYVARNSRQERLARVAAVSSEKKAARAAKTNP
jgi:transposase